MADEPAYRDLTELVQLFGWIGVNPVDDTDQAHLLLYPGRRGVEDHMRGLADVLGLVRADGERMPSVPPDTTWLTLADSADGRAARLRFGELGVLWWAAPPAWEAAVTNQPEVVLWCGLDSVRIKGGRGVDRTVDRYLDRTDRVYAGVVQLIH